MPPFMCFCNFTGDIKYESNSLVSGMKMVIVCSIIKRVKRKSDAYLAGIEELLNMERTFASDKCCYWDIHKRQIC